MKKIFILVPEQAVLQAIADPHYCFSTVNQFLVGSGKQALFEVKLVGAKPVVKQGNGLYAVFPEQLIADAEKPDIIIIPALYGDMEDAVKNNSELIPWIVEQYKAGSEVASLCVGAFLLASTGLLNGQKCSTHWGFAESFNEMYPEVMVDPGTIVTEQNGIYSSGGANSYWNLLLHLVEKYTDRQTAVLVAKYFAIDISRNSQSVFAMFRAQKNHSDEAVKKVQDIIEQKVDERFTIDELAQKVAVGRRSLERRFKIATNNSVLEYIQRVKIEAAKRNLENNRKSINEIMLDVGYSDIKAFRTTFKKITGFSPIEYKNKYSKALS